METLELRMARLEADLARLSSSNRRYRVLLGSVLVLASLPYVLGGVRFDDRIKARVLDVETINIVKDGKRLGGFTYVPSGLSRQEGADLELCAGDSTSVISLRSDDVNGPGILIKNKSSAGVFPVLRLGSDARGNPRFVVGNKTGQAIAQIGADSSNRGFVTLLEDRTSNGLSGLASGNSLSPIRQLATMSADGTGFGAISVNDASGKPMVSLGVSSGIPSLSSARLAPGIKPPSFSGKVTIQNQVGAVLFKAP